tara:strand:+ start:214 stop:366 length:153 start_codon:yes stop_codon:yes gene_type:complete
LAFIDNQFEVILCYNLKLCGTVHLYFFTMKLTRWFDEHLFEKEINDLKDK